MVHRSESELTLDNILFEKRNMEYGAFEIRSVYNSYLKRAMLIAGAVFTLALVSPKIIKLLEPAEAEVEDFVVMKEVILAEPPPIDPKTTPPPPPPTVAAPAPPPQVASTEFLPPKIMEDEKVIVEKEPPTQTELHTSNPGSETREGETDNLNQLIVPGDGAGKEVGEVEKPMLFVGEPPVFQGDYMKFLRKNFQYPDKAKDKKIQGKVHVKFVVEKDGSITDITLVRGLSPECDEEAIRVVKLMDKKWSVGKNNGVPARVWKNLAIDFQFKNLD